MNKPTISAKYDNGAILGAKIDEGQFNGGEVESSGTTTTTIWEYDITDYPLGIVIAVEAVVVGKAITGTDVGKGVGYKIFGGFRYNTGGTLALEAQNNTVLYENPQLTNATAELAVSGNKIRIRATGIAAHNFVWNAKVSFYVL
jgi:hypothetical protein